MTTVSFNVNDPAVRGDFFTHHFPDAIDRLAEDAAPLWGKTTRQHMVEHLIRAFEASRGRIEFALEIPEHRRERIKGFLMENMPTPREFGNPAPGDDPPQLRHAGLEEAKEKLREEMERFFEYFRTHPDALHTHSVFGPLNAEEWERSHYKHCYHHLLQFDLLREEKREGR